MRVIVGGILRKENKILLVQEAQQKAYKLWNFPAGHLDDGETIFDGAIREIFEECGCKVKLTKLLPIISSKERDMVRITFLTEILEENIQFDPSEILDVKWVEIEEIKNEYKDVLRGPDMMLEIIRQLEENEVYPLEVIRNFVEAKGDI